MGIELKDKGKILIEQGELYNEDKTKEEWNDLSKIVTHIRPSRVGK